MVIVACRLVALSPSLSLSLACLPICLPASPLHLPHTHPNTHVNKTKNTQGAAIRVDGGSLTINQTLFYNNTDWSSGGAIYTTYSTLTIEGTNFLNNSASSGAALKTYQSEVEIYNSHFGGGTAWADGGALEFVESTGHVYDNILEYNTASSGGCVKLVGSNITFTGLEFQKNKCKNTGAVFDAYLSNTTIEG